MRSKSGKHRPERLAALIQESIAATVTTAIKDPRVGFVTVTGVTVSPDGTHCSAQQTVPFPPPSINPPTTVAASQARHPGAGAPRRRRTA